MHTLIFMVLGVFLIVLQTTALQLLPGGFGRPDLTYMLVAFAAYRFAWLPGILLSFTMGWIFDVLVGINLGIYPLECLLVFCCLKLLTSNTPVKAPAYEIPLIGISYFLLQMLVYFLSSITVPEVVPAWSWGVVVRETILLVLAAIPCFLLFNSLYEYLELREKRSKPSRKQRVRRR